MKRKKTRREFLRTLTRSAALVGLGGLAARLLSRSNGATAEAKLCRRCPALDGCRLPEGERTRRRLGIAANGKGTSTHGLCGVRPRPAPGSRWTRREVT